MSTPQPIDRQQRKSRIITLVLLAILLMSLSTFLVQREDAKTIIVTFPTGTELEAEVADTPEKLLFGLAFQEALPPNGGMIYIFEQAGAHRVTTKEYRFAVDLIWIDEQHQVVQLLEKVEPCRKDPCPWYGPPPVAVRYLIEAAAGFIKEKGVGVGDELKYTLRM
ncbi:conserved protein of unknown function [Nitrospira japonica]|uniref:DUF192 domain-containing protein n=1 Tax=Nitrospira japonica TaxID=1325564 RepID=A0A1W1I1T0_9BACT|nr:DUF192 domain-containing protein [Nitrospira japonica]SLM46944.1 conserved protein of unknown function [Nitrospira japonica]